ncbi:MAG: FoF1 ATP synthase subunit delta/epsilon [Planctomycetaceae bacterium]
MAIPQHLQLVLVTPEKTLLDEPVDALRFPLYDGQFGVLPGRAPVVGRLGYGELKITSAAGERSYYIDGGFVQIKGPVVSLLTDRAVPAEKIDAQEARGRLDAVRGRVATTDAEIAAKDREQTRARQMLAVARKG